MEALLILETIFVLKTRLTAMLSDAVVNKRQCALVQDRIVRITDVIESLTDRQKSEVAKTSTFSDLQEALRSAEAVCERFDKKRFFSRLMSTAVDSAGLQEIFSRLNTIMQDLHFVMSSAHAAKMEEQGSMTAAWIEANKEDAEFAKHEISKIAGNQEQFNKAIDTVQHDVRVILGHLQIKQQSISKYGELKAHWEVYDKEIVLDKVFDDERRDHFDYVQLGKGSFGVVYRGRFRDKPVAVKEIRLPGDLESNSFRAEVEIYARIHHPNIVTFYGASMKKKHGFILMEIMSHSLHDAMYRGDAPSIDDAGKHKVSLEVAHAMSFLHGSTPPIVHRDLKPDNILFSAKGITKIADFGLAVTKSSSRASEICVSAAGTESYMAPELLDRGIGTTMIDVFSYAIVVNEMYQGTKPWPQMSSYKIGMSVMKGHRPPTTIQQLPATIALIIKQGWVHNASLRPTFVDIALLLSTGIKCANSIASFRDTNQDVSATTTAQVTATCSPSGSPTGLNRTSNTVCTNAARVDETPALQTGDDSSAPSAGAVAEKDEAVPHVPLSSIPDHPAVAVNRSVSQDIRPGLDPTKKSVYTRAVKHIESLYPLGDHKHLEFHAVAIANAVVGDSVDAASIGVTGFLVLMTDSRPELPMVTYIIFLRDRRPTHPTHTTLPTTPATEHPQWRSSTMHTMLSKTLGGKTTLRMPIQTSPSAPTEIVLTSRKKTVCRFIDTAGDTVQHCYDAYTRLRSLSTSDLYEPPSVFRRCIGYLTGSRKGHRTSQPDLECSHEPDGPLVPPTHDSNTPTEDPADNRDSVTATPPSSTASDAAHADGGDVSARLPRDSWADGTTDRCTPPPSTESACVDTAAATPLAERGVAHGQPPASECAESTIDRRNTDASDMVASEGHARGSARMRARVSTAPTSSHGLLIHELHETLAKRQSAGGLSMSPSPTKRTPPPVMPKPAMRARECTAPLRATQGSVPAPCRPSPEKADEMYLEIASSDSDMQDDVD
eukprot:m.667601 g.667601  ORF g.667601 m.667601 type:complete len:1001 (-) comp22752_c0_seq24:120-3122(-)